MEVASLYRYRGTALLPSFDMQALDSIFNLIFRLMARRFPHQKSVVIKPSDACNNIMDKLLTLDHGSKCILVHSDLEHFLVATLKLSQRAEWVRLRANELFLDELHLEGRIPADPRTMDDVQIATCVWVLQMKKMRRLVNRFGQDRVRTLDSELFMASQPEFTEAGLRFFGIDADQQQLSEHIYMINQSHSKASATTYSTEQRRQDYGIQRSHLAAKVNLGVNWAIRHFGKQAVAPLGQP
jgi:hypothetical protein